jgi:RNA-binding protein
MTLTTRQKQDLKAKAHSLKPVVLIGGNGATPAVLKEIDGALAHHELIKVRIASNDRDARRAMLAEISASTKAELVQTIGNIGVFYRLKI